jgi:hypothetical protein
VGAGNQVQAGTEMTVSIGGVSLSVQFAAIQTSASGATPIVAAVTGSKIRVLAYNYMAAGTVNVKWQSAATDKTGLAYLIANTGKVVPFLPVGWCETNASEALNINLSAGGRRVGGELVYCVVPA